MGKEKTRRLRARRSRALGGEKGSVRRKRKREARGNGEEEEEAWERTRWG